MIVFDIKADATYPRHSEGDTLSLAGGRLLLAWSRFRGPEDHAPADIVASLSNDGGAHWSAPYVLVSSDEARQNVMSVSLLRERDTDDLLLFYLCKNHSADCQVHMRRSHDEGNLWTEPTLVSTRSGYHVMNNARVVQLESGRLLAPVAWTRDYRTSPHFVSFCYYSDNGGLTWQPSRDMLDIRESPAGCQEPGLVELKPREVLMYIRTDRNYVFGALSKDDGESWSAAWPFVDLPAPLAPATMARLPDQSLVVIYNHRVDGAKAGYAGRTPLAAARSLDAGYTWHRLPDIESSPNYCYAYTSLRIEGERVLLTYYVLPKIAGEALGQISLRFRVLPLNHWLR